MLPCPSGLPLPQVREGPAAIADPPAVSADLPAATAGKGPRINATAYQEMATGAILLPTVNVMDSRKDLSRPLSITERSGKEPGLNNWSSRIWNRQETHRSGPNNNLSSPGKDPRYNVR